MLPDGTGRVKLNALLTPGGNVTSYAWAPDASRVLYRADQTADEVKEIFASLANGTSIDKLNPSPVPGGNIANQSWSPDGSVLVHYGDVETDGIGELFMSTPDGGAPVVQVSVAPLGSSVLADSRWPP